jgi:xylulokinase|tara:strand:- start:492 stop:1946 length:1455 start_codon:yes stop_codon:yes gene_type:complete
MVMYLGIDIGTTGVKVLLLDQSHGVIGSCSAPLTLSRPALGWSEQNPEHWINATSQAIDQLKHLYPHQLSAVLGIGLSGQMHGAVVTGMDDKPLRPCILWNDGRSGEQCKQLSKLADFEGITGNLIMPGFTAPKLKWMEQNEPEVFDKIHKVLLPKDYVRLWLTGAYSTDVSDASGTLWLNVSERNWSDALLQATHLSRDHMPELFEGNAITGQLRPELAMRWRMKSPIVAGGAGDNAASACGMGVITPGNGFISLGTSGVVFAPTHAPQTNTEGAVHSFCHAMPGMWHTMGVILSAADSLNWLASLTNTSVASIANTLPSKIETASEVQFLPYLAGERTPHNDVNARGAFVGLQRSTTHQDLVQAVMEGVAFALTDCLDAITQAGTQLNSAYVVGGGSKSGRWLEIISAAVNLDLIVPEQSEFGAALGAARLAFAAETGNNMKDICLPPKVAYIVRPDAGLAEQYTWSYMKFRSLYPSLNKSS